MDPPPLAPRRATQTHAEKEEQIHTYTQNDARKRLRMLLQAFYWYVSVASKNKEASAPGSTTL